jgi:hypothetical protein
MRVGETNGTDGTVRRMEGGSPKLGWIDDVENNFRNFGFRDRKHATSNLEHLRGITGESRVNLWLLGNNRSKVSHISHTVHYNLITVI